MKRIVAIFIAGVILPVCAHAEITLEECLEKAEANYPLIEKYELVERTTDLMLSDVNKSWLPRVGVYGQGTVQNVVPEFPRSLNEVIAMLGQKPKGLGHVQYKIGVDVNQTIWDGGTSKAQREIERAQLAEQQASIAVKMYGVREKVMNLYFGILLMDEQIAQTENTAELLQANLSTMRSMLAGGVAMQSDVDMIEAQLLAIRQQITAARSCVNGYRDVLGVYLGESLEGKRLQKPMATMPSDLECARPELELFEAQERLNKARNAAIESTVMPKMGLFAQAYYGYPGFNYFESMINRNMSWNLLAGVKVSWNIDSFYTKKNSRKKLALAGEGIENDRDVFLFNTRLQTSAETEEINGLRAVMEDDERIVELRGNVRRAAESQLKNGVIDATALLAKITDENQARLTAKYHEIQLIQSIYKFKNTINR